jgi:hypothetical protein
MALLSHVVEGQFGGQTIDITEDPLDEVKLPDLLPTPASSNEQWDPKRPRAYSDLDSIMDVLLLEELFSETSTTPTSSEGNSPR